MSDNVKVGGQYTPQQLVDMGYIEVSKFPLNKSVIFSDSDAISVRYDRGNQIFVATEVQEGLLKIISFNDIETGGSVIKV